MTVYCAQQTRSFKSIIEYTSSIVKLKSLLLLVRIEKYKNILGWIVYLQKKAIYIVEVVVECGTFYPQIAAGKTAGQS